MLFCLNSLLNKAFNKESVVNVSAIHIMLYLGQYSKTVLPLDQTFQRMLYMTDKTFPNSSCPVSL